MFNNKNFWILKKYFSFILGGGIGAVITWSLTYFLTEVIKTWYILSFSIAAIIPLIFKFIYHRRVTFSGKEMSTIIIIKYIGVYVLLSLLNICIVYLITTHLHIYYMLSIITVTLIISVFNFLINDRFVFKKNCDKDVR